MALILDKSITGTTIDESGNTITGYTNLSYEMNNGIILDNPYLVIDEITINKFNKYIKITTLLFKDKNSRGIKSSIKKLSYMIYNTDILYNNYFSIPIMENTNIFKSAYKYINDNIFINWKSDE